MEAIDVAGRIAVSEKLAPKLSRKRFACAGPGEFIRSSADGLNLLELAPKLESSELKF